MRALDHTGSIDPATGLTGADRLWRGHGPGALRLATVLVGPDDAHDVTVNAFLRVVRASQRSTIDSPGAYLLRAVANEARSHQRRLRRRMRRDLAAVRSGAAADPESHVDVRRAIAQLRVRQRAVVFLVYWEDMTESAVAEVLGLSTGTVHQLLVAARARLRRTLR